MSAKPKPPEVELAALAALKASIADILADDPEFLLDAAEAETDVFELLDRLILEDAAEDGLVKGLKGTIDELAARKSRIEQRRERRRALIEQALYLLECRKLERPAATLSLVTRPGKVELRDEAELPARFFVMQPQLDKAALKAALEAGEIVEGAKISDPTTTLTLRRR